MKMFCGNRPSLIVLGTLFLCFGAFASDQIPDVDMHAVVKEVVALQRYMFSEAEFLSAKNENAIKNSFPLLEKHLGRLKSEVFQDQPNLKANVSMLSDQISEAAQAFGKGHKSFARYTLVSSLQMCIACHTRTTNADFVLADSEMAGANRLEKADYYFATRQFVKGREIYEQILSDPSKKDPAGSIALASLALAVYYAKVKENPKEGGAYFLGLSKNKKFSETQRNRFLAWAEEFQRWAPQKGEAVIISDAEAMGQARDLLKKKTEGAAAEIESLRASSLLHKILEGPGETSPLKAEALLALGKIYEKLDYPLYYRFGDMYLKACISDYKKTKPAQECYKAFHSAVKKRVGKGGANAPANIEEADLFRWRKIAY